MPDKTISDLILDKFAESIAEDKAFTGVSTDLVSALRQKQGKGKIKDLLRRAEDAHTQP